MRNGIFKLLQRQLYTCLSSRNGYLLCIGALVLVLVSGFQFGEVALVWSMNQYAAVFNSYHDNIAGKSFQDRLCAPIPIDIVYTWVNGTDPELLEELSKVKLEFEAELNRTRLRERRKKLEEELLKNQTIKLFNQSRENITIGSPVEKTKLQMFRRDSAANTVVYRSNQTDSKQSVTITTSLKASSKHAYVKRKNKRIGSRGLRTVDRAQRDEVRQRFEGKGVKMLQYKAKEKGKETDHKSNGGSRKDRNVEEMSKEVDKNNNENKKGDTKEDNGKEGEGKVDKDVQSSFKRVAEQVMKGKSEQLVPDMKLKLNGKNSKLTDKVGNATGANKSNDICQGKLCIPAFALLIEEGLPSNISLKQVRSIHRHFASATEVFQVTSVGSHIETATFVQFPYQKAVLDASMVVVPWLNKNLTSTLGYLTNDTALLHSVVLQQLVLVTNVPVNITQLQLTRALAGRFKSHVVSVTLHTNYSVAVVKFDNATYIETVLKLPKGNVTIRQQPVVFQAARLVWNPLLPTVAPGKDGKTELEKVSDIFSANRFQDNEELRYSLRSVEKFAPWVRHIYLVTNGQIPYWLDLDNPRLTIITHNDIFLNKSHLPTFSSPAIESHIHRIPGLSKKVLYLNDDVMFGQPVWPDDFYTHSNGQKAYLAWQVPHCAEGCPPTWITDKYCDKACNNSACDWDGGDCTGVSAKASSLYRGWQGMYGGFRTDPSRYCNTGCADSWMGDRYCDSACNVFDCGFDAGDCGVVNFGKLYGIDVTDDISTVHLPLGLKSVYFNLSSVVEGRKITEGDVTKADVVRVAVVAQRYKTLSLVFHPRQNLTLLSIRVVCDEVNKTKISILFNVTVDTSITLPVATVAPTTAISTNITSSNETMMVRIQNGTQSINFWNEDIPVPRQPELFNTLEYAVPLFRNGTIFPSDVASQLSILQQEYKIGDLTEKGYYRRKAKILKEFIERNQSAAQMTFGSELPKMTAVATVHAHQNNTSKQTGVEGKKAAEESRMEPAGKKWTNDTSEHKDMDKLQPTLDRELKQHRKILWISNLDGLVDEVYDSHHRWSDTDEDLFVANWIANTKRKQLQLYDELERTKKEWLENHPESRSGFKTRGVFPWEKQQIFDDVVAEKHADETYTTSDTGPQRKLMDAFADSLKYVNRLYNRKYGYVARKVPAHCPHMIDIDVMAELQLRFPDEYEKTSSHQLRDPEDMQFAFSYYYYMIGETLEFNLTAVFSSLDTDGSGILSYRELRTLMSRIYDLPITLKVMEEFERTLYNCSKSANYTVPFVDELDMEYNYDDAVPLVTLELLSQCQPIVELLNKTCSTEKKFKMEVLGEDDVAFKMIEDNITKTVQQLDWIRKHTRKFICLNDNIDHRKPDAAMVKALIRDFLESLFPEKSQFELPLEYRNRFLHMDELNEWRKQRDLIHFWTHVAFACILVITLASLCVGQLKQLRRKWHNFVTRLRRRGGRGQFVAV
ncbi:N-acetylglucosamine-1-phosphotransferase subunits alpha/beta-like [Corticium candelabrum]|uniref:N-acetylglucosamine-1-phosphotransferase subunits alpha/beta-like n=1 Tax=Corticium candelabrum TaxID=121492 RepID=UPI002E2599AE|nr:N-acetylglucosamine-1-phosphotransferase subunits alpha/beta-like [Corticium candelabrum]